MMDPTTFLGRNNQSEVEYRGSCQERQWDPIHHNWLVHFTLVWPKWVLQQQTHDPDTKKDFVSFYHISISHSAVVVALIDDIIALKSVPWTNEVRVSTQRALLNLMVHFVVLGKKWNHKRKIFTDCFLMPKQMKYNCCQSIFPKNNK